MSRFIFNHFIGTLLILAIGVYILMEIKHEVMLLEKEQKYLNSRIIQNKKYIHLLNAEFNYLSSPDRIKQLSHKYLSLAPIHKHQYISIYRH